MPPRSMGKRNGIMRPPVPPFDEESARQNAAGRWWRSYGNEQWEFDDEGYMRRREASINDVRIEEPDRRIFGPRPESERGAPLPPR
jgi:nuclear transport factor 2 (NTF2) superfamily protein